MGCEWVRRVCVRGLQSRGLGVGRGEKTGGDRFVHGMGECASETLYKRHDVKVDTPVLHATGGIRGLS